MYSSRSLLDAEFQHGAVQYDCMFLLFNDSGEQQCTDRLLCGDMLVALGTEGPLWLSDERPHYRYHSRLDALDADA